MNKEKGYMVKCLNKNSADKVKDQLTLSGFVASTPRKKNPRILIPAIPVHWGAVELLNNIQNQSNIPQDV